MARRIGKTLDLSRFASINILAFFKPDESYQSCLPNYSNEEGRDGQCKSIWKCNTMTEDILKGSMIERGTIDPTNACIINDK